MDPWLARSIHAEEQIYKAADLAVRHGISRQLFVEDCDRAYQYALARMREQERKRDAAHVTKEKRRWG